MLIFDFYAGTGSATQAFKDAGHTVISFELDTYFEADEHVDVRTLKAEDLIAKYGRPDFVWASPPCTTFSMAACYRYWQWDGKTAVPKSPKTLEAIELVKTTIKLLQDLDPKYGWLMENPRALLRKQDFMQSLNRQTITYCQYGAPNMKPTDLWGEVKGWTPRPMCKPRMTCHNSAKRGSDTGTQGMGGGGKHGGVKRGMVPIELGQEILDVITVNNL
jgi:site-specific DNA-cytosine methylase